MTVVRQEISRAYNSICDREGPGKAKYVSRGVEKPGPSGCGSPQHVFILHEGGREGGSGASAPGSPGQGRVLRVATGHRVGGTRVIGGGGRGGAGQVDSRPQHQIAYVTHWVENLQQQLQT